MTTKYLYNIIIISIKKDLNYYFLTLKYFGSFFSRVILIEKYIIWIYYIYFFKFFRCN